MDSKTKPKKIISFYDLHIYDIVLILSPFTTFYFSPAHERLHKTLPVLKATLGIFQVCKL